MSNERLPLTAQGLTRRDHSDAATTLAPTNYALYLSYTPHLVHTQDVRDEKEFAKMTDILCSRIQPGLK